MMRHKLNPKRLKAAGIVKLSIDYNGEDCDLSIIGLNAYSDLDNDEEIHSGFFTEEQYYHVVNAAEELFQSKFNKDLGVYTGTINFRIEDSQLWYDIVHEKRMETTGQYIECNVYGVLE